MSHKNFSIHFECLKPNLLEVYCSKPLINHWSFGFKVNLVLSFKLVLKTCKTIHLPIMLFIFE